MGTTTLTITAAKTSAITAAIPTATDAAATEPDAAAGTATGACAGAAAIVLVFAVAWPAFAFGGVYPLGYAGLAVLAALFALLAIVAGGWRVDTPLTLMAVAVVAAVGLQLIPLPSRTLAEISPAAAAFLATHNLGFALAGLTVGPPPHPLSIDPAATWRFILFFASVCLLFAGVRSLGAVRPLRFLVTAVTVVGAALALIGLVQSGAGSNRMYGIWAPQTPAAVFGPFVNRNHFAAWMLMALPLALTQCAAYARAMRRQAGATHLAALIGTPAAAHGLLSAFAALAMSVALLMTRSRSGIAGFVVLLAGVVAILAAPRRTRRGRLVMPLLVIAVALVGIAWMGWRPLIARFDELPGTRLSGRLDAWSEGARIATAFWPTGSGLNTYAAAMVAYHDPAVLLYFRTPHNDYLQLLADGGLLVGIPVAAMLGVLGVRIVRAVRSPAAQSSFDAWTRCGGAAGLAAVALQELVDFSIQTPANAVLIAVVAAYVVCEPVPTARSRRRVSARAIA